MNKVMMATVAVVAWAATAHAKIMYYTCGEPHKQVMFVNLVDGKRLEMQERDGPAYRFDITKVQGARYTYRRGYLDLPIMQLGKTRYECDKNTNQPDD
jgi:hypothetical protein